MWGGGARALLIYCYPHNGNSGGSRHISRARLYHLYTIYNMGKCIFSMISLSHFQPFNFWEYRCQTIGATRGENELIKINNFFLTNFSLTYRHWKAVLPLELDRHETVRRGRRQSTCASSAAGRRRQLARRLRLVLRDAT